MKNNEVVNQGDRHRDGLERVDWDLKNQRYSLINYIWIIGKRDKWITYKFLSKFSEPDSINGPTTFKMLKEIW